jgi:RimJ/RimL family protein N-acetyltransferase
MLYELSRNEYDKVRDLYEPFRYHLSSFAVLDGNNPGKVFVDNLAAPLSSYMYSPEACYLAGSPDNEAFNHALNGAIFSRVAIGGNDTAPCFVLASDAWSAGLETICDPRSPLVLARRHYICRELAFDWRANLPDGFTVQSVDETLLNQPGMKIPDHIPSWIQNNWGSTAAFFEKGFGLVTLHDHRVVSWSMADCVSGDACEIGIRTDPEYRQRGLAAITAAAAVDYAQSHGLPTVGWHCNEDNLGSIKTAEKVGFELERGYTMYDIFLDEAEHLSETAYIALKAGRYQDSADQCERVFALRNDMPHYIYHMAARAQAALGNTDQALAYLDEVVKRDWSHRAFTESCPEFESLRGLPQWTALLDRMS